MHANTVFLLGLGLLLVVGRGFGYLVPEDGIEGKRSDVEEENLGRSDDLNRLELKEEDETLRDEDGLDPTARSAAAAAAAAGRQWYKNAAAAGAASRSSAAAAGAASRHSAAAAGAASRAAAAAAAAAARMNSKRVAAGAGAGTGGNWEPWPSSLGIGLAAAARYGMRNEETLKDNDEITRLAALKYMEDESIVRDNELGIRTADYEDFLKNGEDDDYIGVVRDDPSFELYYRYMSDPLRQYEDEMQSMDEAVAQEPDSFSKRVLETVRESTPQVYYRLLENVISNDVSNPTTRGAAAAAAAASGWRSAAAAAAAAGRRKAAAAAAAAAARSAAAAAAASGWRSAAARSAAAAAAAAGRRSPISPIPASYRLASNRSAAAAAAAAGRRSAAARSAAAAAAAAGRRAAAAAAAAASG